MTGSGAISKWAKFKYPAIIGSIAIVATAVFFLWPKAEAVVEQQPEPHIKKLIRLYIQKQPSRMLS
jgi:hypothetical protein